MRPNPVATSPTADLQVITLDARATMRRWRCRAPLTGRPGAHHGLEVSVVTRGAAHYRVGSSRLSGVAGDAQGSAVLVRSGVEHETHLSADFAGFTLELDPKWIDEVAEHTPFAGRRLCAAQHGDSATLQPLLECILHTHQSRTSSERAFVMEGLMEALARTLLCAAEASVPSAPRAGRTDVRIRAALEYIEAHLEGPVSMAELAKSASLSRYHFSRRFREQVGRSPHQYVLEARARRAAQMLRKGNVSVTRAAFDAGFQDLGRFRAAFKRAFGTTPQAFVAANRARRSASLA